MRQTDRRKSERQIDRDRVSERLRHRQINREKVIKGILLPK